MSVSFSFNVYGSNYTELQYAVKEKAKALFGDLPFKFDMSVKELARQSPYVIYKAEVYAMIVDDDVD